MIPLILVCQDEEKIEAFLDRYKREHSIRDYTIFDEGPVKHEFSITQLREIKKRIIYTVSDTQLYIIRGFDTASYEAQNSFLKTLEEPQRATQFILIVNRTERLLPTILSRCKIITLEKNTGAAVTIHYEDILKRRLPDQSPDKMIDEMISLFRDRLQDYPTSTVILRELLKVRALLENNSVEAQLAVDHLIYFIREHA